MGSRWTRACASTQRSSNRMVAAVMLVMPPVSKGGETSTRSAPTGYESLHPHHFHRGVCDQPAPSAANPAVERDLCCRTGGGDNNPAVRLAVGPHRTPHLLFSRHVFHGVFRLPAVLASGHQRPAHHHPDRGRRSKLRAWDNVRTAVRLFS